MVVRRLLGTVAAYLGAAYLTLVLVVAGYGIASPRAADGPALQRAGVHGAPVFIGIEAATTQTPDGLRSSEGRFYAVLPDTFTERAFWVVSMDDRGVVSIRRSAAAFWTVVLLLTSSIVAVLAFFLRAAPPRSEADP